MVFDACRLRKGKPTQEINKTGNDQFLDFLVLCPGRGYKPLIQVRDSRSHRVRPKSKELKGKDTRNRADGQKKCYVWQLDYLVLLKARNVELIQELITLHYHELI